ncbi:Regulator of nonsense transcripts 1 [Seminavis robusta]|uniref:Regulator of nonsense transcripts 1 n=1 Tax=Seminavis robusta TaxID=568900 RepID=A0A9N8D5Q3_9STRA|nr:Regulator of nonsense transcripts 1 [Seminavis robusta]|eukprot:Sro11_g008580.1 Regulator of nonsense transcripts 1 (909) ;mRNA; r:88698-91424
MNQDDPPLSRKLKPYERFFAALLRSSATDYLNSCSNNIDNDNDSSTLWTTICRRVHLCPPMAPLQPKYEDANRHFAPRAALVLEECRSQIADSLMARWGQRHNNGRRATKSSISVQCASASRNKETGHTTLILKLAQQNKRLTKEQLFQLRPGTVMEIIPASNNKNSVEDVLLGCVLYANRENLEQENASFGVMIFQQTTTTTSAHNMILDRTINKEDDDKDDNNDDDSSLLQVSPIAGLISELRQFEACTNKKTKKVPFINALLGHFPKHTRFHYDDDDDDDDDTSTNCSDDESDNNENKETASKDGSAEEIEQPIDKDLVTEPPPPHTTTTPPVRIPTLNPSQEEAASNFLGSSPGSVTLCQGPPGTGKSTLLVAILCRYILKAPDTCPPRIMVCAPTNKAVTVVATRFLRAIIMMGSGNTCNIVLVGDMDKLLETDEASSSKQQPNNNIDDNPLRSIFIYTWLSNILQDYKQLREQILVVGKSANDSSIHSNACRLHQRLVRQLPVATKGDIANLARKVCKEVSKLDSTKSSSSSSSSLLTIIDELLGKLSELSNDDVCRELLNTGNVIFCTLASAGSMLFKWTHKINDLIVDEASAATEPELCIPFYLQPRRLLVVGDPQQLPATVKSQRAVALGHDKSLQERLMNDCHCPYTMLDTQYRMKPEISSFPSLQFYKGKIQNGDNVTCPRYRAPVPLLAGEPYSFVQVSGTEERAVCGSYRNHAEALRVVDLIHNLRQGNDGTNAKWHSVDRIRVITFYRAQVQLVQSLLSKRGLPRVLVATVDSSQGCEADLVIVSFVRSKGSNNRISEGFLSDDRRVNVALTRAKYQLICVGNAQAIVKSLAPTSTLHGLATNAVERKVVVLDDQSSSSNEPLKKRKNKTVPLVNNKNALPKTSLSRKKRSKRR